ncbi:DNA topoisomerase IB [Cytophaga aurantiaca]|uniref:DNA topoisomerase IB n=1 Tax=Cytophaga aurantiaca TaxID=29530 RepID=UPI0003662296|nr:DNA topoisomerase IB [Cytophaga aurantiaca]
MTLAQTAVSEFIISKSKIAKCVKDYEASAKLANLIYVGDNEEGIIRKKRGTAFSYYYKDEKISDKKILKRIKQLVIPPAWENVWICLKEYGHIQATGIDSKKRKQYRYHPNWSNFRDQTKYYRLKEFASVLPAIRSKIKEDLAQRGYPRTKVLAAIISIMESTSIRVGNNVYEKLYGSYGLSTMQDKHVKIKGDEVRFLFKGKKGVYHRISLKSRKLAHIISQCKDIPGKELFQYFDEAGNNHCIDSGDVNAYIREISGGDFTSKDFRTWTGTVKCLQAFRNLGYGENKTHVKRLMNEAMDIVAHQLGNTRSVCKKHYIHPGILTDYENGKLEKYINKILEMETKMETNNNSSPLITPTELVLVDFLKK